MYNLDCVNWGTLCNAEDIITCEDCPHFTYQETNEKVED